MTVARPSCVVMRLRRCTVVTTTDLRQELTVLRGDVHLEQSLFSDPKLEYPLTRPLNGEDGLGCDEGVSQSVSLPEHTFTCDSRLCRSFP